MRQWVCYNKIHWTLNVYTICHRRRKGHMRWGRRYFTTDGQSVSLGIEHPCGTCDQILLPVGMLLSEICCLVSVGRLSDEKTGLQFAVQSLNGPSSSEPITILYCFIWEPPTWRTRFPYLYPPGTGWPSYTPGHWVPFTSPLTTRRATVEVL
jgi:hypothetical protein